MSSGFAGKCHYRRRLPHFQLPDSYIFITWRLHGSLPRACSDELKQERRKLAHEEHRPRELAKGRRSRHDTMIFAKMDRILDLATTGPTWLSNRRVADVVEENLLFHASRRYDLWAYVIMANHVLLHPRLLDPQPTSHPRAEDADGLQPGVADSGGIDPDSGKVTGYIALATITHGAKSYTAGRSNRILGTTGRFWQDESYDHIVRDEAEFWRIVEYIENNPVAAGYVDEPSQWRWSSARLRAQLGWDYHLPLVGGSEPPELTVNM